jgi:hypothetical protein
MVDKEQAASMKIPDHIKQQILHQTLFWVFTDLDVMCSPNSRFMTELKQALILLL